MILVTGGGGYIGQRVVRRLLATGHDVRCLLSATPAHSIAEAPNLHCFIHHEPDDALWEEICEGVHCIIHLRSAMWWGRERDLEAIEIEGTRALLRAARHARVGQIILLSHLDASTVSGISALRIKGRQEQLVRESGLAHTILRSALVFGEGDSFISHLAVLLRVNPFFFLQPGSGEYLQQPIFVGDLVEGLLRAIQKLDVIDETVTVGGPEYLTFADLVRTVMRVTGMQRSLISSPPILAALAGQPSHFCLAPFDHYRAMARFGEQQPNDKH